jgi:hypothetical protein
VFEIIDMRRLSITMIRRTVAITKKIQEKTMVSGLKVLVSNWPKRSWNVKEAESR